MISSSTRCGWRQSDCSLQWTATSECSSLVTDLVRTACSVLLLFALIAAVRSPNFDLAPVNRYVAATTILAVGFVAIGFFTIPIRKWFLTRFTDAGVAILRHIRMITVGGALVALTIQALIVAFLSKEVGFDVTTAYQYSLGNMDSVIDYLSFYTNNQLYFFLMYGWTHLLQLVGVTNLWLGWNVLNLASIDTGVVLVALAARSAFGIRVGYFTAWAGMALLVASPRVLFTYTDTLLLPLVGAFLLLLCHTRRPLLGIVLGVAAALMYLMKPSAAIYVIAAIVLLVAWMVIAIRRKTSVFTLRGALRVTVVVVGFMATLGAFTAFRNTQDIYRIDETKRCPETLYFMMGMQGNGGYNWNDVAATYNLPTIQEKREYNLQVIRQRLGDFGFAGYVQFLSNKYIFNTHDGSFAWSPIEGVHSEDISPPMTKLKDLYYSNGRYADMYRFWTQLVWVLVLLGSLWSFRRREIAVTFLRLAIVGGLVFLLISEAGRTRYLIQYLPLFMILSAIGLDEMAKKLVKGTRQERPTMLSVESLISSSHRS